MTDPMQSVAATTAIERERPSWQRLEALVNTVRAEEPETSDEEFEPVFTPAVERIARAVLTALIAYEKAGQGATRQAATSKGASSSTKVAAIASALVPLIVELSTITESYLRRRADEAAKQERLRRTLEAELTRVGKEAESIALVEFQRLVESAQEAIDDATADQVDMHSSLHRIVSELHALIDAGEELLSAGTDS